MESTSASIESTTASNILDLATWNRPRSSEELQNFIRTRHNRLLDLAEIE